MTDFSQPTRRRFLGTAAAGVGALAGIGVSGGCGDPGAGALAAVALHVLGAVALHVLGVADGPREALYQLPGGMAVAQVHGLDALIQQHRGLGGDRRAPRLIGAVADHDDSCHELSPLMCGWCRPTACGPFMNDC